MAVPHDRPNTGLQAEPHNVLTDEPELRTSRIVNLANIPPIKDLTTRSIRLILVRILETYTLKFWPEPP
jgi:hypothetical protein